MHFLKFQKMFILNSFIHILSTFSEVNPLISYASIIHAYSIFSINNGFITCINSSNVESVLAVAVKDLFIFWFIYL